MPHLLLAASFVIMAGAIPNVVYAQLKEPEVVEAPKPRTPLSEGYHTGVGFNVVLNNFGFGVGGYFRKVLGDYTTFTFQTGITGIRDVSEQTYQSFFTGNRIVPNKYKRALGFPFLFGFEQRIFAQQISDNFRLFVGGAAGPAMAFVYPYVNDTDGNGFRTYIIQEDQFGNEFLLPEERVNDFFSGWGDGETKWGYTGELKIGADIGSSFGTRTTIEFGFFFYYFKQGLQIMEPYRPYGYNDSGFPIAVNEQGERREHYDAQKYFGTPQIKFTFGGMW